MKKLSGKQRKIVGFIDKFVEKQGYSPSVREVAGGCNINSSTVAQYHLNILAREGYISRSSKVPRSIALLKGLADSSSVPLLGTIAAGAPIPVPDSDTWVTVPEEFLEVPKGLLRGRPNVYALKVKGTSMIDALIDDGDIVLMQQADTAENGTMVAVWLNGQQEVTLKKIYRENHQVCLKPANKLMEPIYCQPDDVQIQGRVIGIFRQY